MGDGSIVRRALATVLVALGLTAGCAGETGTPSERARPRIVFEADTTAATFGSVRVDGIPVRVLDDLPRAAWAHIFRVHLVDALRDSTSIPGVLGRYAVEGAALRFRPRFPFDAGRTYRASFDGAAFDSLAGHDAATASISQRFVMPRRSERTPTRVDAVYPSAARVPENLLRIYVHFSGPMRAKDVHEHVHLYDSAGNEIDLAFVEVPHGLWDVEQRRLTLFLHPGRIKRGVGPHRALGPPLRAGETYRLVVNAAAADGWGRPLAATHEHVFRVTEPDRDAPDPSTWTLHAPERTDARLRITFPEALDHAMLQRLLVVRDARGNAVAGDAEVGDGERSWSFTPHAGWVPGSYAVDIDPTLEDVAGNSIARPFESAPRAANDAPAGRARADVRLRFHVAS